MLKCWTRSARWRAVRSFSSHSKYVPEHTNFLDIDLNDQEMFGIPRVESTRLQAAARRIAEYFMVYDAIDQTLLEHEAQLDFGDGDTASIVDVDAAELGKLDRENVSGVRQYLFNSYQLQKRGQLSDFIEDLERIPQQGLLPREEVQARLDHLLRQSDPNLSEVAKLLAGKGVPNLSMLNKMMKSLLDRGYYQPCQVVLDSLLMSRETLNMQTLAIALSLATLGAKKTVFYSYALVAMPDSATDSALASRFGDISAPSEELIESLAFGFAKFQDAENLDRVLDWAKLHNVLSLRALRTNMRAALQWQDEPRANKTISILTKLGTIPEEFTAMATKISSLNT